MSEAKKDPLNQAQEALESGIRFAQGLHDSLKLYFEYKALDEKDALAAAANKKDDA